MKCWNPIEGGSTIPAAGPRACSVQSVEFIRAHASGNENGGKAHGDISIFGQESNYTTWRLAKMNLAIRGIGAQISHGDSFHNDGHPDLKADFILANPPFNVLGLGRRAANQGQALGLWRPAEWQCELRLGAAHGSPPRTERDCRDSCLANGSMSSNQSGEGDIRKKLIEAELVDCMVALRGQLFYSTPIPACLWFWRVSGS